MLTKVLPHGPVIGALLCIALLPFVQAETIAGRVVSIADGDTLTVLDAAKVQHKIRLAGIDAPEKSQAYGSKSRQSLSELVFEKQVAVETNKKDKYGRHVGKVVLDGQDVNLEQVKRGLAWIYRQYQSELSKDDRALYSAAEQDAKLIRRGLWLDSNPILSLEPYLGRLGPLMLPFGCGTLMLPLPHFKIFQFQV